MAKIDDPELLLKHHSKLTHLRQHLENLTLLQKQRDAWASAVFSAKGQKPHTNVYVNVFQSADLPPVSVAVPVSFITGVVGMLTERISTAQNDVREIVRDLTAVPRPKKTTRSRS